MSARPLLKAPKECFVAVVFGMALGVACQSKAPSAHADGPAAPRSVSGDDVRPFFPTEPNTILSFRTTQQPSGERGLLVFRVTAPRSGVIELHDGGRLRQYELHAHEIRTPLGTVLKSPLTVGSEWQGELGRVTVTQVGSQVRTPQGVLSPCVVTEEVDDSGARRVTTTYCRGVGMARILVEAETDQAFESVRAELQYAGPPFDASVNNEDEQ